MSASLVGNDRFVDLLRHGAVVGGERFRGAADDRLSARGLAQMRAAVVGFGREAGGHSPPYDALFSSPASCRAPS